MEEILKSVVEYRKKIEKMPYFMQVGRLLCASAFIVSTWKEFHGYHLNGGILGFMDSTNVLRAMEGTFFISNPYLGALLLLIHQAVLSPKSYDLGDFDIVQFRQSLHHFLHRAQSICKKNVVYEALRQQLCDQLKFANDTESDMSCYNGIMVSEELRQQSCDQINEIKRIAISSPFFTPVQSNTFFMPLIQGVGIVAAALVLFIVMKKMYVMILKKHKTN